MRLGEGDGAMNSLRVRPFLVLAVLGAALSVVTAVGAWTILGHETGRRGDAHEGPLTAALRATARAEVERVFSTWKFLRSDVDESLEHALRLAAEPVPGDAAVSWVPGLCTKLAWPGPVERAGVVRADDGRVLSLVELAGDRCIDRTGTLAIESITGPPFPTEKDVVKLAMIAQLGVMEAREGETRIVAVHRQGAGAHLRIARREKDRIAFADVDLRQLVPATAPAGVDLHALLVVGQEPAGYIVGGPRESAIPGAINQVKAGTGRALDLPDVADQGAAKSVDAWLRPWRDDGNLALAGARSTLDEALNVDILAVASVEAPTRAGNAVTQLVLWILVVLCAWMLVMLLTTRTLARILWQTAQQVREAWLGLRDDDVGSKEDLARARTLLGTLTDRMQDLVVAAFGRSEKFWAPAPIRRLLQVLRRKLGE